MADSGDDFPCSPLPAYDDGYTLPPWPSAASNPWPPAVDNPWPSDVDNSCASSSPALPWVSSSSYLPPLDNIDVNDTQFRICTMDNYLIDNEMLLTPSLVTPISVEVLAPPTGLAGIASDNTKLYLETAPDPVIYNNAVIKQQYVTAIFAFKGPITAGLSVSQCYNFYFTLRGKGSFTTFYNKELIIKSVDLDETEGMTRLRLVFKIKLVTRELKGNPFVLGLVMRPRPGIHGLYAQVAETGDISVRSQKPKPAAISKLETSLLQNEWISCLCTPCSAVRFCPLCKTTEFTPHLTNCPFHLIELKQQRLEQGPPAKKQRREKK